MKLNDKENEVVATFLDNYSARLSRDCCNDWDFPSNWTQTEKEDFVRGCWLYNGTIEEFDPNHLQLPNFMVSSYLAYLLRN